MYTSIFLIILSLFHLTSSGFVPPAEWCLPSSHLKELSGCIAMTDLEEKCEAEPSEDEKLDCYCTQEVLSSYYA